MAKNASLLNNISDVSHDNVRLANEYAKIAYVLTASLGIIGNFTVIFVIGRSAGMRKTYTNIFILNQSIIDFCASILILVTTTTMKSADNLSGITGQLYCRLWMSDFPLWILLVASSYSLIALTFERYMSIVHPLLHHSKFSRTKVLMLAGATWCIGLVLSLCFIVHTAQVVDVHCQLGDISTVDAWKKAAGVIVFVLLFLAPTACFVTCYIRIFICLRNGVADGVQVNQSAVGRQKMHAKRNVLKTLFIVVVCYILCNAWNQVAFLAFKFGAPLDFTSYFYHFTMIALFANSCINPFIYAFQFDRFKKEVRRLFKCTEEVESVTMT